MNINGFSPYSTSSSEVDGSSPLKRKLSGSDGSDDSSSNKRIKRLETAPRNPKTKRLQQHDVGNCLEEALKVKGFLSEKGYNWNAFNRGNYGGCANLQKHITEHNQVELDLTDLDISNPLGIGKLIEELDSRLEVQMVENAQGFRDLKFVLAQANTSEQAGSVSGYSEIELDQDAYFAGLNLSGNKIKYLDKDMWKTQEGIDCNLDSIRLDNNQIAHLNFEDLPELIELKARNNSIKTVAGESESLQRLILKNNAIVSIQNIENRFPNLFYLNLEQNPLDYDWLRGIKCKKLTTIVLSENSLTNVQKEALTQDLKSNCNNSIFVMFKS